MMRTQIISLLVLLASLTPVACKSKQKPVDAPYTSAEGAVGFDAQLKNGAADFSRPTEWMASYKAEGRTARFKIQLDSPTSSSKQSSVKILFGRGRFIAQPGSESKVFIAELRKALEARTLPAAATKIESLPFEYAVLATSATRASDGSMGQNGTGNWLAMKLFLGDDKGEVYLNLNPVLNKGEFSIKDPDYGDYLVSELAKVL